ncbi:MAG: tetratricopeptide repeat protein, partial [Gemmatimonadaceae bacterium]|nr:tetratricopeptide repeat protein [Gemmatimonadaceae bacterium]
DKAGIQQALAFQAREDIFDVFTWQKVDVRVHVGEPPLPAVFEPQDLEVRLNLSGMSLLMEAARRADEWELIRQLLPSEHDVLAPVGAQLPEGVCDRRLAILVDGYRSAYEIANTAPIATLEGLKTLGELVKQGHLKRLEPPELAKVGVEAERDEDWEKALHVYELAASRGLEHLDLYRRIARAYQRLGRSQEALDRWVSVADRCVRLDRRDLAVGALRDALELDQSNVELRRRLARLLVDSGLPADAAVELRAVVELAEKQRAPATQVVDLLTELLELAPTDRPALEKLAGLHLKAGDTVLAMTRLDDLASAHIEAGHSDEAVAVYYRILDIDGENLDAHLRLAQTLAKMGSTDDAVREYR